LRRREEVQLFRRRIPVRLGGVAIMITLLGASVVGLGTMLLLVSEFNGPAAGADHGWLGLAFEATSAFATVGLSTGITPALTVSGKLIVIALMFVGRVGPLMLAMYLSGGTTPWRVRYPSEEVSLG
jgi:trk system potassium uptake protein TrkH